MVSRVSADVAIRAPRLSKGTERRPSRPAAALELSPGSPPALAGHSTPPRVCGVTGKDRKPWHFPVYFTASAELYPAPRPLPGHAAPAPAGKHARQPRPPGGGSRRGPAPAALPLPARRRLCPGRSRRSLRSRYRPRSLPPPARHPLLETGRRRRLPVASGGRQRPVGLGTTSRIGVSSRFLTAGLGTQRRPREASPGGPRLRAPAAGRPRPEAGRCP